MRGILALDLATKTGWAFAWPEAIKTWPNDVRLATEIDSTWLRFGTWKLDASHGPESRCVDLRNKLCLLALDVRSRPAIVARERQFFRGGAASDIGFGLATTARVWAYQTNSQQMAVPKKKWLEHLTGKGDDKKESPADLFRARGLDVKNNDEADALGVLHWAIQTSNKQVAAATQEKKP